MSLTDLGAFLNFIIGGVLVAVLTASVAAYRRIKAGAIVDDDAVISRLDGDNVKIRAQHSDLLSQFEEERRKRWRAEDLAASYRRQLSMIRIEPIDEAEKDSNNGAG